MKNVKKTIKSYSEIYINPKIMRKITTTYSKIIIKIRVNQKISKNLSC